MTFPISQGLFQYDLIDHFAILGVSIDAGHQEIRQRYLKIAYKLHPDTCRIYTPAERERANQLLSKLVNPAYEHLGRDLSREEFRLTLAQMGKAMARDLSKITINSEPARKLAQSSANYELAYQKILQSLAIDQYTALENTDQKIAQLSELNMVYLMLTEGQGNRKTPPKVFISQGNPNNQSELVRAAVTTAAPAKAKESPLEAYIRRAQASLDQNNPAQALRELRDALREEPDNSICHALLGLAYLRQNQLSMARVHINRAWKANPQDATVIRSKRELDKVINSNTEMQDQKGQKEEGERKGGFWSRFGGKKK
ncbi:J domain-containing protein [Microcystis aeruginosa]|jgi:curved DNA-binding protein CbpA|uniref:Tetratricopeptide repeat protein n=2 Tax=Microcystis TaxID=1125 RepID=A0A552HAJ7_MICVR|nr:DnaJ domain-containing protein [Microcystis aeruginosa]NCR08983.1 DnaJ domain-containing protein [Microcystis aeruginosa LG13-11]TRU68247.1 MAG: tetratricopeptide repeat protein [Microcystis viridis Mv_BB_P_19951000_S68D]TRU68549.1 MAG: tetratricopeptide repeat protein [Microcystis viridis Mv_BB_P_19951000_S69]TRU72472.1 MAG: tetratricopeptide repeat protein [Microcystis viridis Mv_BB_P_19951000_S68]TRU83641.1 MAG: tetratricopeptide repeat protein [Microcystis viridis Mv_BB_P_19951000_S69D]